MDTATFNSTVHAMAWIFFALLCSPIVFVLLDYWSGTRKAKRNGIPLMSHGMRKSFNKLCTYYNAMLALAVVDVLQLWGLWYIDAFYDHSFPLFPWLTAVGAAAVACIEIKSIYESAEAKQKKQAAEVMDLAKNIASHHTTAEEIARQIAKYLNNGTVTTADSEAE